MMSGNCFDTLQITILTFSDWTHCIEHLRKETMIQAHMFP